MTAYTLSGAIALAADIHKVQVDKGDRPYILHCIRVMEDAMRVMDGDITTGAVAVLHDTIEDHDHRFTTSGVMREIQGFGSTVLNYVMNLTHGEGEDYLEEYIPRIAGHSEIAIVVKMADLRDNMTILRQPTLTDKDLLRLQKYHMAYRILREARGSWTSGDDDGPVNP